VTNVDQIQRITSISGARISPGLSAALRARKDGPEAALQLGVAFAALQCADLLRKGTPGIHFYTLTAARRPGPSSRRCGRWSPGARAEPAACA